MEIIDILSDESKGKDGEIIRNYCPFKDVNWRHGKVPDYSRVNKLFFEERTKKHIEGSLEALVQSLIKNWEVDMHNVGDHKQWRSMDIEKLRVYMNGKGGYTADQLCAVGPYNGMLGDTHPGYKASDNSFLQSEEKFVKAMPRGFAFEVLHVYSGPPVISFSWRHWGHYEGEFVGSDGVHLPSGQKLELFGHTIATVDDQHKITKLEFFFDGGDIIRPLVATPLKK